MNHPRLSATSLLSLIPLALVTSLAACSSSTDGGSVLPIAMQCDARVACDYKGSAFELQLGRSLEGKCLIRGDFQKAPPDELTSDGRIIGAGDEGHWSQDGGQLVICWSSDCLRCTPKPAPTVAPAQGKCVGNPYSCDMNSPGSCARIQGCMMQSHLQVDGSWNYSCEGSADSCSDMDSADSCHTQGCRWE